MNKYLLAILLVSLLVSCKDECEGVDCLPSDYWVDIYLYNPQDGSNFLFGPQKEYEYDSLKVYLPENRQRTFETEKLERIVLGQTDTILRVYIVAGEDFVLQYDPGLKETFSIIQAIDNSECCGTIRNYNALQVNGQTLNKTNGDDIFLYPR